MKDGTPLTASALMTIKGVGASSAGRLAEHFETMEALAGAEPAALAKELKLPVFVAKAAVGGAREALEVSPEPEPAADEGLTVSEPAGETEAVEAVEAGEDDELYVTRKVTIDKFTQRRTRVLVTPTVCTLCAYDAARAMGYTDYADLPNEELRQAALRLLREHDAVHYSGEAHLLRKRDLPTSYTAPPAR